MATLRHDVEVEPSNKRYWAWEFLRRNHAYQQAFKVVSALSPEQQNLLQGLAHRTWAIEDIDITLPFAALDANFNPLVDIDNSRGMSWFDVVAEHGSVGAVMGLVLPHARAVPLVTLREPFSFESYALSQWVDPSLAAGSVHDPFATSLLTVAGLRKIDRPLGADIEVPTLWPEELRLPLRPVKIADRRRVYDGKKELRPKLTAYGYEGKSNAKGRGNEKQPDYFERHESCSIAMAHTDLVVKLTLTLPLAPQLRAVEKAAREQLQELEAAGFCEQLSADGTSQNYPRYLDLLDGLDEGLSNEELAVKIGIASYNKATRKYQAEGFIWSKAPSAKERLRQMKRRARALRDYQFLQLALS